ncbi:glycine zipper domain-containing protein [Methylophaga sp.]|jgi:outer membrane lipoprotein SlyB|uniref:glycine zipper domain-containing protein n=1 Tax=Methylophaga sp. TaxID=2024840 RepID=UPI003A8F050E
MKLMYLILGLTLSSSTVFAADSSTVDAAIGGAIGGAIGAAVGNEVGGRDGAIIGGGLGGATGAAVSTHDDNDHGSHRNYIEPRSSQGFCPPGQAKKGNC